MLLLSLIVNIVHLIFGETGAFVSGLCGAIGCGVLLSTVLLGAKTGFMISVALGRYLELLAVRFAADPYDYPGKLSTKDFCKVKNT